MTRLKVVVLGVPAHGVWRVECHGGYAARHWPAQVAQAQLLARDGRPVPATIRIESKTGRSAVHGKSLYKVPVLRLEDAFVLPGAPQALIEAPAPEVQQIAGPEPEEPLPPLEDEPPIEVEASVVEEPATEAPEEAWRAVSYAVAQADRGTYFRELSAFQRAVRGLGTLPEDAKHMTLGMIADAMSGAV